jgi:hypothetical protein
VGFTVIGRNVGHKAKSFSAIYRTYSALFHLQNSIFVYYF